MDPFTHGLAGAAASLIISRDDNRRPAAVAGFLTPLLADLDFFIHSHSDPLFNLEIHRQFSHSLLFIPLGALIAFGLLWWFMRKRMGAVELYFYCLASYATAGLLDACTSYGTMLLWPFSDDRIAWNIISVIDPVFTLLFAVFIVWSVINRRKMFTFIALLWFTSYFSFGYFQKERATRQAELVAESRGHLPERMVVKPTIGNLILWRSVYEYEDRFYADAIRILPFTGTADVYRGHSQPRFIPEISGTYIRGSVLYNDMIRFRKLSDGFLVRHPDYSNIIGDARYSMIPYSLKPLWGIRVEAERKAKHTEVIYFRDASPQVRNIYYKLITGTFDPGR